MVISAEREKLRQAKAEREAEKARIRAAKEAARAEKELKKRQELAEREQKKKEREALEAEKELKRREKEARKQQDEAEKEQRRREKEAVEAERENKRKERELKRQLDEAEKEQKRKEKEAAERKKQLLLQKQANIMDRFVRRKEADSLSPQRKQSAADNGLSPSPDQQESNSTSGTEPSMAAVMLRLDEELRSSCIKSEDELLRNHVLSWQEKWKGRSSEPFRRWGVRLTPKDTVFRELRLQGAGMSSCRRIISTANTGSCSNSEAQAPGLKRTREEDGSLDDSKLDDNTIVLDDDADIISSPPRKKHCNSRWKLLQFDKSHRPAYYGTFSKVSSTVGPRHPLRKDPSLDYEVDSDEEWEEEDPGESLSDCEDKEDETEKVEPELDVDAADGFVVPDGYLSENEGVHLEETDMEDTQKAAESSSPGDSVMVTESSGSMDQLVRKHQHLLKLLDNVTKHALQRNRPFLVSDLLQQPRANVENHSERLCFQALRMCIVAPNILMGPAAVKA